MIKFASEELREALSDLLSLQRQNYKRYLQEPLGAEEAQLVSDMRYRKRVEQQRLQLRLQAEVKQLVQRHRVSPEDFRAVLAGLV